VILTHVSENDLSDPTEATRRSTNLLRFILRVSWDGTMEVPRTTGMSLRWTNTVYNQINTLHVTAYLPRVRSWFESSQRVVRLSKFLHFLKFNTVAVADDALLVGAHFLSSTC
jgi:hypothetical protein